MTYSALDSLPTPIALLLKKAEEFGKVGDTGQAWGKCVKASEVSLMLWCAISEPTPEQLSKRSLTISFWKERVDFPALFGERVDRSNLSESLFAFMNEMKKKGWSNDAESIGIQTFFEGICSERNDVSHARKPPTAVKVTLVCDCLKFLWEVVKDRFGIEYFRVESGTSLSGSTLLRGQSLQGVNPTRVIHDISNDFFLLLSPGDFYCNSKLGLVNLSPYWVELATGSSSFLHETFSRTEKSSKVVEGDSQPTWDFVYSDIESFEELSVEAMEDREVANGERRGLLNFGKEGEVRQIALSFLLDHEFRTNPYVVAPPEIVPADFFQELEPNSQSHIPSRSMRMDLQKCSYCSAKNPTSRQFCHRCGKNLHLVCPDVFAPNPPHYNPPTAENCHTCNIRLAGAKTARSLYDLAISWSKKGKRLAAVLSNINAAHANAEEGTTMMKKISSFRSICENDWQGYRHEVENVRVAIRSKNFEKARVLALHAAALARDPLVEEKWLKKVQKAKEADREEKKRAKALRTKREKEEIVEYEAKLEREDALAEEYRRTRLRRSRIQWLVAFLLFIVTAMAALHVFGEYQKEKQQHARSEIIRLLDSPGENLETGFSQIKSGLSRSGFGAMESSFPTVWGGGLNQKARALKSLGELTKILAEENPSTTLSDVWKADLTKAVHFSLRECRKTLKFVSPPSFPEGASHLISLASDDFHASVFHGVHVGGFPDLEGLEIRLRFGYRVDDEEEAKWFKSSTWLDHGGDFVFKIPITEQGFTRDDANSTNLLLDITARWNDGEQEWQNLANPLYFVSEARDWDRPSQEDPFSTDFLNPLLMVKIPSVNEGNHVNK